MTHISWFASENGVRFSELSNRRNSKNFTETTTSISYHSEGYYIIYPKMFRMKGNDCFIALKICENARNFACWKSVTAGIRVGALLSQICDCRAPRVKKAFDTIEHEICIHKREHYGLHGLMTKWLTSYLLDRKQYAYIDGGNSGLDFITNSVSQGPILGPLLFTIYVNDMQHASNLQQQLLADDTNIHGQFKHWLFDTKHKLWAS